MAENTEESKQLRAFISNLEKKLLAENGEARWRLEDAFVASRQYGSVRKVFENNLKNIADVLSSPGSIVDKERVLESIFGPAILSFRESVELPDRPIPEEQQKQKGDSLASTFRSHTKETEIARKKLNDRAYAFAHELRVNLEKQLREKGLQEDKVQNALTTVDSDLAGNLGDATTEEAMQRAAASAWSKGLLAANISPTPEQMVVPIEETSREMASLAQAQTRLSNLNEVPYLILENIDKVDPSVLFSHVLARSESGAEALEDAVGSAKIEYAASHGNVFADLAKNTPSPAELYRKAGLKEVVDLLTRNKNPSVARALIATELLRKAQELQEKLGKAAVPGVETLRNRAQAAFVQAGAGDKKLLEGVGFLAEDLWGALGRGPNTLVEEYYRGNKSIAQAIASIKKDDLSGFDQLVGMMAYAQSKESSIVFDAAGNLVLNWGPQAIQTVGRGLTAESGSGAAVGMSKGLAARLIAWGVARGGLIGGAVRLAGVALGPIGTVVTFAITAFSGPILSFFSKLIRGEVGGFWAAPTSAVLGSLGPLRKKEEIPSSVLVPGIAVGCLALVILPVLLIIGVKGSAEVVSLGGPDFGGFDPNYVHPGGTLLPENIAAGECPIENGRISTGSLNASANTGHGSPSYWGGRRPSYGIPIEGMTPGCFNQTCPYYGFATDVVSRSEAYPIVVVPKVCPSEDASCGDLEWKVVNYFFNCAGGSTQSRAACNSSSRWGWGVILTASGNGHEWRLYLSHLDPREAFEIGQTFHTTTTNVIGTTTQDLGTSSHVHIELNMDGIPIRPDFLCH